MAGLCCGQLKVIQIAKAYANKLLNRNKKLSDERMAICNGCDKLKNGWCLACSCWMPAKTTLTDKNIKCEHPDGSKW
jgi:hypothetical protein